MDSDIDLTKLLLRQRFGWAKVTLGFVAVASLMTAMIVGLLLPVYFMETMPNARSPALIMCMMTALQLLIARHCWRVYPRPMLHEIQTLGIVYMMAASTAMVVGYIMNLVMYYFDASLATIGVPRFSTLANNVMFFCFEISTLYMLCYGILTWIAAFGCIWTPVEKFNIKSWSIMSDPKMFNAQARAISRWTVLVQLSFVVVFFLSFGYPPPELHVLVVSALLWFVTIYPLNVHILPRIARRIAARRSVVVG